MNRSIVALIPLLTVACAGIIWYVAAATHTTIGAWPLLLVGPGVVIRWWELRRTQGNSGEQTHHAPRIIPILLFLFILTALVGAWAAYDPAAGWGKFWVLLGGVMLFGIIITQKPGDARLLLNFLSVTAGLVALQFLLTHDWNLIAADIGVLNQIGLAWMDMRPQLPIPALHPNFAGGMLIMLLPFQAVGVLSLQRNAALSPQSSVLNPQWLVTLSLLGLSLLGLLMSSSRGAWLSLAAATGLWLLWLVAGWLADRLARPRQTLFLTGAGVGVAAAVILILVFPGGLIGLVNRLPGLASGESRWEIYQNTIRLVGDYPFTGSGLHSFPGLYSRYILNIPYFLFDYSHNLYLDILLEHGVAGFLLFMAVVGSSLTVVLIRELRGTPHSALNTQSSVLNSQSLIRWAAIISLVAVLLHGLMDNALHGGVGTPLLFVPAAMALWATPILVSQRAQRKVWVGWGVRLTSLAVMLMVGMWLLRPLRAEWQANLGAVALAKAELAGWPELEQEIDEDAVGMAQVQLENAHTTLSTNLTANYRLGLLKADNMEYAAAIPYLEAAYQVDPGHRGIIKTLGYSYVWSGQPDKATWLLSQIPEASGELETYQWWWGTQDRPDLAEYAAAMAQILAGN